MFKTIGRARDKTNVAVAQAIINAETDGTKYKWRQRGSIVSMAVMLLSWIGGAYQPAQSAESTFSKAVEQVPYASTVMLWGGGIAVLIGIGKLISKLKDETPFGKALVKTLGFFFVGAICLSPALSDLIIGLVTDKSKVAVDKLKTAKE